MSDKENIGKQQLWFDQDSGFIVIVHNETMTADEATGLSERIDAYATKYTPGEPPFILVDDRRATGFTGDARKVMSNNSNLRSELYCALFGATFAMRAVLNLLFRAVQVTTSSASTVIALATEEEARAWPTEQRRAYSGAHLH